MTTHNDKFPEREDDCPHWELAKRGLWLMLNNKQRDAEDLFKKYPQSLQMNAGYAFVVFADALMTFEDEKLSLATQTFKDIERKCSSSSWIQTVKTRVFGNDPLTYAEHLESQIILADTYVFLATLTFLQQDISGYFKGGWILRKAFKLYQSAYNEILSLYREIVGERNFPATFVNEHSSTVQGTYNKDVLDILTLPAEVTVEQKETQPKSCTEFEINGNELRADVEESEHQLSHIDTSNIDENVAKACPAEINTKADNLVPTLKKKTVDSRANINGMPSSVRKNGYITHKVSSYKNTTSKRSSSYHDDLSSQASLLNINCKSEHHTAHSTHVCGLNVSTPGKCSSLKKSKSLHSALSETNHDNIRLFPLMSNSFSFSYFTTTFHLFASKGYTKNIDEFTITRLLCAVSFGYGLLQLGISLLPPSVLKLTSFLGYSGDLKGGLDNLMYARLGEDMRAPCATLVLLWYHTIVRPFFGLDGINVKAGYQTATQLINETSDNYANSALFLYFRGRIERLNSDIPAAIRAFQSSIEKTTQREIKTMSLHEVGWCYLIELDFARSESTFQCLKQSSKWSRSFYAYLAMTATGAYGMFQLADDVCQLRNVFKKTSKGTQLDEFLNRRWDICPTDETALRNTTILFWKLLAYELLYLWNALPSCAKGALNVIIDDCQSLVSEMSVEPMAGLAKLIEGSCLCIMGSYEDGVCCFRTCLEKRKHLTHNCESAHVSAFAQFELGVLLTKNEETKQEGKKLLQTCCNYKNYDFEQRLLVRIHAVLKTL